MEHRIMLCYNYETRESIALKKIKQRILEIDPSSKVIIVPRGEVSTYASAIEFKPTEIVGCPPVAKPVSELYYALKSKFGTRVLCVPSEGLAVYTSSNEYTIRPYLDDYGPKLVDGEFFWGNDYRNAAEPMLLREHKISDSKRLIVSGSPLFECFINNEIPLPEKILSIIKKYNINNRILCSPTFSFAGYMREMLHQSQDYYSADKQEYEKKLNFYEKLALRINTVRDDFIKTIVSAAVSNKELLFLVTSHPVEKQHFKELNKNDPYKVGFKGIKNILYIDFTLDAIFLMPHVGCFLHCGSSGTYASYLFGIKNIMFSFDRYISDLQDDYPLYINSGLNTGICIDITEIPNYIAKEKEFFNERNITELNKMFLLNALNYNEKEKYEPSKIIAHHILNDDICSYQDISKSLEDRYFYIKNDSKNNKIVNIIKYISRKIRTEQICKKIYHKYIKRKSKFPSIFMIETVLGCNIHCTECAVGGNLVKRKYGKLGLQEFITISEKIKPYCKYLYLHMWGEPTLNPNLFQMIKVASSYATVNISTNACALSDQEAIALVQSGARDIIVSIDGMTQPTYEKYRRGGNLEKALHNLLVMSKNCPQGVNLLCQYIVFQHNSHEMASFSDFCVANKIYGYFKAPYLRSGSSLKEAISLPQYTRKISSDTEVRIEQMKKCLSVRDSFTIALDGSVIPCCYDHNNEIKFGNIFDNTVSEIWNSEEYIKFRKNLENGDANNFCLLNCLES